MEKVFGLCKSLWLDSPPLWIQTNSETVVKFTLKSCEIELFSTENKITCRTETRYGTEKRDSSESFFEVSTAVEAPRR